MRLMSDWPMAIKAAIRAVIPPTHAITMAASGTISQATRM
jgi:hypothetical protein